MSSEKTAHTKTKSLLDQARGEVTKIKEQVDSVSSSSEASLRAEREKHASLIQQVLLHVLLAEGKFICGCRQAHAEKAAEIAEVEQRAEDRMKDLKSKLGTMGKFAYSLLIDCRSLIVACFRQARSWVQCSKP